VKASAPFQNSSVVSQTSRFQRFKALKNVGLVTTMDLSSQRAGIPPMPTTRDPRQSRER
jgi:hypothetical protein